MNKDYFIDLYEYTFWANRAVWDCVMQLTDEQFEQPLDYSIGAIHTQVAHTMRVEYWWLHFLCEREVSFLNEEQYANREVIRATWDELENYIRAYLRTLTPEELDRDVKPTFWDDDEPHVKVYEGLLQVANHSTDHRAQTLAGLHRLGAPTVAQDYLDYAFQKRGIPFIND